MHANLVRSKLVHRGVRNTIGQVNRTSWTSFMTAEVMQFAEQKAQSVTINSRTLRTVESDVTLASQEDVPIKYESEPPARQDRGRTYLKQ